MDVRLVGKDNFSTNFCFYLGELRSRPSQNIYPTFPFAEAMNQMDRADAASRRRPLR